ncbi:efflux RND transporter periplasmic adaptor subunit [Parasphingorhabdus sp.]|uniref:efflux RND transporter periplasmic adaptor subunit n=1 Tax=Parasphingorhabdus sp. TaxID=2709688 RepID=UPI003A91A05C
MKLPAVLNRRNLTIAAVLVPLVLLFIWVALRAGPLAPINVTVAAVEERAIAPSLFGIGTVEARYTQRVGSTAPGRITMLVVDVGDSVEQGQLLAQIDPVDLDQRIDAAASTEARNAAMEQSASAQISDASARVRLARTQAARVEALIKDGWVTEAMVDQRRQELAAAQASLAAAQANLAATQQDRARAGLDRSALIAQKANLRLVAPRAGLVVKRAVEPGTTVVAGQTVVEIVDPAELWINARFDQTRSGGLTSGLKSQIKLRSKPDTMIAGSVIRVEPLADAVTEEILAKIGFLAMENIPPIGELAEVTIILPAEKKSIAIPNSAIQNVNGKIGVWTLRDGDLTFVPISLGVADLDGWVQIKAGLKKGDQIVTHSAAELSANSRISVLDKLP